MRSELRLAPSAARRAKKASMCSGVSFLKLHLAKAVLEDACRPLVLLDRGRGEIPGRERDPQPAVDLVRDLRTVAQLDATDRLAEQLVALLDGGLLGRSRDRNPVPVRQGHARTPVPTLLFCRSGRCPLRWGPWVAS